MRWSDVRRHPCSPLPRCSRRPGAGRRTGRRTRPGARTRSPPPPRTGPESEGEARRSSRDTPRSPEGARGDCLVVGHAAAEQEALALGRLERRRRPLVERIRGLHVVVVVDEERALAPAGLADDRGRSALDGQRFSRYASAFPGPVKDDPRGLRNADPLRRHGRLSDKHLELVDVFALARAHKSVERREVGHARKGIVRSERSSFGSCSCRARTAASTE